MTNPSDFLMTDGCPWVDLRKLSGVPNVRWCEDQICSWITTPANTWSNLGYIFVGFFFLWMTRKEKSENLRFYGVAAQWVGWTSFVYHASLTFATQVLDFLGMFVFFYLILVQNFARIGIVRGDRVKRTVWIATAFTTIVSAVCDKFGFPIQGLVILLIVAILATEVVATKRATRKVRHGWMIGSLVALGIAAMFSAADVTRKFCDPTNHWIQGHAIWHGLGSVALLCSIYFYRQFYSRDTGELTV
jgi:hypothetical protein